MRQRWGVTVSVLVVGMWVGTMGAQAAAEFASPVIEATWTQAEQVQPNFWGPLATARDGQPEAYKEAPGGKRTVQYFDKARMEQSDPNARVTTGLLTVELKSGKLQLGDSTFEQHSPAQVNMAGDPGSSGPTYADLSNLNERYDNADTTPNAYIYASDHTFRVLTTEEGRQYAAQFDVPSGDTFIYQQDPSGRYGQFVYAPFIDFINRLTSSGIAIDQTPGYVISPVMVAQVPIGGKATTVFIQAFERRVLTYNPNNDPAFRVEFGNIGQHYERWRYGG
jgi:polysaccharide biosynthesis protein PslG